VRLAHKDAAAIYEITVQGELDRGWERWFSGLSLSVEHFGEQPPSTTLTGHVPDQPALRGILSKLWDLNLILISVRRIEREEKDE
jgi:hypothetical protein